MATRWDKLLRLTSTYDLALVCTDADGAADGEPIGAHRNILALASPVFHALLYGEMAEPMVDGVVTLPLPGKTRRAMRAFVDACYLGDASQLGLPHDPELNLLSYASEYQFTELKSRIEAELVKNLHAEAAVDMLLYARLYSCTKLEAAAAKLIVNCFDRVSQAEAFARLPAKALLAAYRDNELNVTTEADAFRALVIWHDGQATPVDAEDLRALLSSLRWATMDHAFVEAEVAKHAIFDCCDDGAAMRAAAVALASSSAVGGDEGRGGAPSSSGTPSCTGAPSSGSKRLRLEESTPLRAPPAPSSLLLRTPAPSGLAGEFATPSLMRSSVKLSLVSRGGQTFRFDESETDGYFAWLGSAAGSREWRNPVETGQVSVRGVEFRRYGNLIDVMDWSLMLDRFHDPTRSYHADDILFSTLAELTISVPHDLLLTGYACTTMPGAVMRDAWALEFSLDGLEWCSEGCNNHAPTQEMVSALDGVSYVSQDCFSKGLGYFEVRPSRAYRHFRVRTLGVILQIARLELYGSIMSPEVVTDEATRKRARI